MLFFTSDLHLGSDETIKFDNRPFKNSKEFQKKMIKNINKKASKGDIIYILGDFVDCHSDLDDRCVKSLSVVKNSGIKTKI